MPADASEWITLAEFARRKQVSETLVRAGVKSGRIVREKAGIDWTTQSAAWDGSLKAPRKRPRTLRTSAKKTAGKAPKSKKADSLIEVTRKRELIKLETEQLRLRQAKGELVSAADEEAAGRALASTVITALYNIPERISDELAGMSDAHAIAELLERELDMAVEKLRKHARA